MHARGKNNGNWKGGKKQITKFGYIRVSTPFNHPWRKQSKNNGYFIFEHRLVMEKHLGRYLKPNEYVHHINGIKTDNRIENLIVLTKNTHNFIHLESKQRKCSIPICHRTFWALGLCDTHYTQYIDKRLDKKYLPLIKRIKNRKHTY